MGKRSEQGMIVGLDIGTSKVVAIVGEITEEGEIEIIGIGSHQSRGLKKGKSSISFSNVAKSIVKNPSCE